MNKKSLYVHSSAELKNYLDMYRAHLTLKTGERHSISKALLTLILSWYEDGCPPIPICHDAGGVCVSRIECPPRLWRSLRASAATLSGSEGRAIGVTALIRSLLQASKDSSNVQNLPAQQ